MRRQSRIKIIGSCPSSFLFAIKLAKLGHKVFVFDDSRKSNLKIENGIFSFSDSSKELFKKLNILDKLEDISYLSNSIILNDEVISEEILLRSKKLKASKKAINNGWIAEYSKVRKMLINEFLNYENLIYTSENPLINNDFDLVINFNYLISDNNDFLKKKDKYKTLSFKVFIRGNNENRSYFFNTSNGLILLIPLSNNTYQLFWTDKDIKIKKRLILSKSQLLDNLTTLISNPLVFDQIIGEIRSSPENIFYFPYYLSNKTLFVNYNKQEFNILSKLFFNKEIKYFNHLNKIIENNIYYKKSKIRFILFGYIKTIIDIFFIQLLNCLILNLFLRNNLFTKSLRKLLFLIFNKINILKSFLFKYYFLYN